MGWDTGELVVEGPSCADVDHRRNCNGIWRWNTGTRGAEPLRGFTQLVPRCVFAVVAYIAIDVHRLESVKHWLRVFLFVLLLSFVAAGACYLGARFLARQQSAGPVDYHYWIHGRLGLNAQQEKALDPIEEKFASRKRELIAQIREGNRELADAIASDQSDSTKVRAAVDKIHHAQGELQKAVLEHVFEMRPVLRDDQYQRLIKLTADALRDAPELQ